MKQKDDESFDQNSGNDKEDKVKESKPSSRVEQKWSSNIGDKFTKWIETSKGANRNYNDVINKKRFTNRGPRHLNGYPISG